MECPMQETLRCDVRAAHDAILCDAVRCHAMRGDVMLCNESDVMRGDAMQCCMAIGDDIDRCCAKDTQRKLDMGHIQHFRFSVM